MRNHYVNKLIKRKKDALWMLTGDPERGTVFQELQDAHYWCFRISLMAFKRDEVSVVNRTVAIHDFKLKKNRWRN